MWVYGQPCQFCEQSKEPVAVEESVMVDGLHESICSVTQGAETTDFTL